ncbi:MAG TPA: hypothetical protein DCY79_12795, partial [Planctomycetaceae bacterium]|nr:hypothetical protein [Planctomycetaceae bacterium]
MEEGILLGLHQQTTLLPKTKGFVAMRVKVANATTVAIFLMACVAVTTTGCKTPSWSIPSPSWLSWGGKKPPESIAPRPSSTVTPTTPSQLATNGTAGAAQGYGQASRAGYYTGNYNTNAVASNNAGTQSGFYQQTYGQGQATGANGATNGYGTAGQGYAQTADARGASNYGQAAAGYGQAASGYGQAAATGYGQAAAGYGQAATGYG